MDLEALGNIGDFVGGLAVIATLAYLALQTRQNSQVIRASVMDSASSTHLDFNLMLGSNPRAARIFQVGLEDFAALEADEQRAFLNLLRTQFYGYQHIFIQAQQGLVDHEYWQRTRIQASDLLSKPHLRAWWQDRKDVYTPAFAANIEAAVVPKPQRLANLVIERMLAVSGD